MARVSLEISDQFRNKRLLSPIWLISKATWLEFLRRRDLYVVLIFMAIFLMIVIATRIVGIKSNEEVRFLLNLGLTISFFLAGILAVFASVRQIPDEIEKGTFYPLLAKPVERRDVIIGKFLAVSLVCLSVLVLFTLLTKIFVPSLPIFNSILLFQVIILEGFAILILCSTGIFFSLIFPKAVNVILLIILFLGSGTLIGFLKSHSKQGITSSIIKFLTYYIPDFSSLNLVQRYTDGATALSFSELFLLVAYCVLFIFAFVVLSSILLNRRAL